MATGLIGGLQTDSRNRKRPTGGTIKAGQKQDTSSLITGNIHSGGIGFASPDAFKTDSQIAAAARPSFEKATGDNEAGYATMTDSERESYRVKSMGIAPTKTDDYSDWGIARKTAADEAHAEGRMSAQDEKNKRIIDTRDASRHAYDVTKPREQKEAEARVHKIEQSKVGKRKAAGGKYDTSFKRETRSGGNAAMRATRSGSGAAPTSRLIDSSRRQGGGIGPDTTFSDPERYGGPREQIQATLAKSGWTPEQITDYGSNPLALNAQRVQNALPGVQALTSVEAAAQYGGAGKADPMSMALIAGNVMDPKWAAAAYGQGLGLEKTQALLPYEAGGQTGAGGGGFSALGPILIDRALMGR